jgi:hypothetical protein
MNRYLIRIALFVLLVTPLLVSCNLKPGPMESPIESPAAVPVSLTRQESFVSPLPTPSPVGTPGPDTGIVVGALQQTGSGSSLEGRPVYLASIIQGTGQTGFEVARMEPTTDPRATVSADGSFAFTDVQPGKYALFTVTPRGESILLINMDIGIDIIVEVEGSEITDLGVIPVSISF